MRHGCGAAHCEKLKGNDVIDLNAFFSEFLETQRSIASSLEIIAERVQAAPDNTAPAAKRTKKAKGEAAPAAPTADAAAAPVATPVVTPPPVAATAAPVAATAAPVAATAAPVAATAAPVAATAAPDALAGYAALDATSQFTTMLALVRPYMNNPHVHAEVIAGLTRAGLTPPVGRPENPDLPGDGYLNLANEQRVELMRAFTEAVRLVQQAAGG